MTPIPPVPVLALAAMALVAPFAPVRAQEPAGAAAQAAPRHPFTVFMHVKTTDAFLALSPEERLEWVGEAVVPILEAHPDVRMRFYDSEFYSADTTDVIVWETADLDGYQAVVERLRETRFWGPYFTVRSITPARENAFADFYGPLGAAPD